MRRTPGQKTRINDTSEFDDDFGCDDDRSEVDAYMACKPSQTSSDPLLTWWKLNAAIFPGIAGLAKKVLAVMATSAASERNFSLAGHVVSARRSRLSGSSVNDILFLNNALR